MVTRAGKRGLSTRQRLEARDGRGCFYCGKTGKAKDRAKVRWKVDLGEGHRPSWVETTQIVVLFNIDHVLPKSKGGCDHLQNKVWSCIDCNSTKADTEPTMELWRPSVTARIHINCCGEIAANRYHLGLPVLTYPITR